MYEYNAKVLRVVDGDTIDALIDVGFSTFKKERVRLYGINTPESRTRDLKEKKLGIAATERLKALLEACDNKCVVKTELDKKGKYGRILGVIHSPNKKKNFNKMLVSEGHAVEYFGGKR